MPGPDDFGLSAVGTLARVCASPRARLHKAFWSAWEERVRACEPRLVPWREEPDALDSSATHEFESVGSVRIGCVLVEPATRPVSAGLVALHGSGAEGAIGEAARGWRRLAERGVAVLVVRVRGYPASTRDTGDWRGGLGWITRGLDADVREIDGLMLWSLPLAVADVVLAARALRQRLGTRLAIMLHGESLGGGLATIAAARMAEMGQGPSRLAIGVPSLGDWAFRRGVRSGGMGGEVREYMLLHAAREEALEQALRVGDAAVHARQVRCPTLCKLAERDDVVPAPAAAAVFNGIGADPGRKWRFVVPFGHWDGGLANARRHALFARCVEDFLDPHQTPEGAMARWQDRLEDGERTLEGGDPLREEPGGEADEAPALFGAGALPELEGADRVLVDAYRAAGRTLDDLPYTAEFEAVHRAVGVDRAARAVFHRLHTLRKAGRLPRMGRGSTPAVKLGADEEALLEELVKDAVGTLGQRDRLPYTEAFDRVCERFNAGTGRDLSPHDIWRLVARLAK